jgi:hypothetical protein
VSHNKERAENECVGERGAENIRGRLPSEELHKLYSLPNIIRVITSGSMRWPEHVASIEKIRNS